MDFLLECIGFPPGTDLDALAERIRREGEPVAWRGPAGLHLRYPLSPGLEVRLDREDGQAHDSLVPHFEVSRRLRVAVESVQPLPDSPFDALLRGRANPPLPGDPTGSGDGEYPLAALLSDARRLPRNIRRGHVIAVSLAGFALDVVHVGPDRGVRDPGLAERGSELLPLEGSDQPGGCMELSLVVRGIRHLENPLTRERIEALEVDAPGRPLDLFLSRWQLQTHGLPAPRAGWRIEGAFLFSGRLAGGLPPRRASRLGRGEH